MVLGDGFFRERQRIEIHLETVVAGARETLKVLTPFTYTLLTLIAYGPLRPRSLLFKCSTERSLKYSIAAGQTLLSRRHRRLNDIEMQGRTMFERPCN